MSNKATVTDMKKDGQPMLVPKLRFSEFLNAAEWKARPLNQLAARSKQKNRDEKIIRVLTNSAEFGVVDQRDFFDKDIATQGKLDSYFVVELGAYVYNPRISTNAPVGPISKNNIATGVMSPLYTVFKFKDIDDDFYAYYFRTTGWHAYMRQASSTGARHDRMAISSDDFMAMPMPVASPEELKKISDFLRSVDVLIATQVQKLDALKTHRKGLIQQLFPLEGETKPCLRFPEFQNDGQWEPTTMEQIVDFKSGGTPSKGNPAFWNGSIPWASAKDMKQLFLDDTEDHITAAAVNDGAKSVPAGTILMLTRGMTLLKDVPICLLSRQMSFNQDVKALQPKAHFDGRFLLYLLLGCKQRLLNLVDIAGHGTGRLDTEKLKMLDVMLPCLAEQQRIAGCLSSLEELIISQCQKIDALKTYKKGLMQQIFPSPAEVEA